MVFVVRKIQINVVHSIKIKISEQTMSASISNLDTFTTSEINCESTPRKRRYIPTDSCARLGLKIPSSFSQGFGPPTRQVEGKNKRHVGANAPGFYIGMLSLLLK
jgi:hypothetical protein